MSSLETEAYSTEEHRESPGKKKRKKKKSKVVGEELKIEGPEIIQEVEDEQEVMVEGEEKSSPKKKKRSRPAASPVPTSSKAASASLKLKPNHKTPANKNTKSTSQVNPSPRKSMEEELKVEGPEITEEEEEPEVVVPVTKSRSTKKIKKPSLPTKKNKKSSLPTKKNKKKSKRPPVKEAASEPEVRSRSAMQIMAEMPPSDVEDLLRRIGLQCPLNDEQRLKSRELKIHWGDVAFGCYGPIDCKSIWSYLKNPARPYRTMNEIVDEVKTNLKLGHHKFMQKVIETSPGFPKRPYAIGGFQYYCKDLWDNYKELQNTMHKGVGNFLVFQTKCLADYEKLPVETRAEYDKKGKQVMANYKKEVKDYYSRFLEFAPSVEKKKMDTKERVETGLAVALKREALKISNELYKDAPPLPLTPKQEFVNTKLNRGFTPSPTPDELSGLKTRLVEEYKSLSDASKFKWIKKCVKNSERYLEDLEEYKKTHPLFILPKDFEIKMVTKIEELNIWFKLSGEPTKPPITSFELFLTDFRKTNTAESEAALLTSAMAKWKRLGQYQKQLYMMKLKMEQVTFIREFRNYHNTLPQLLRASAVDRLPKALQRVFEKASKEPLVQDDEETIVVDSTGEVDPELDEPSDRKRKQPESVSPAEESNQGEEQEREGQEGEEAPPKKKKKKNRKKNKEDEGDVIAGSSSASKPLYMMELNDDQKAILDEKIREENERMIKASKKKRNANPVPDIVADITNKKKAKKVPIQPGSPKRTKSKKKGSAQESQPLGEDKAK